MFQSPPLAERSRMLSNCMHQLAGVRRGPQKNREHAIELVNLINSIIIPRGWVGLDDDDRLHITWVVKQSADGDERLEITRKYGPAVMAHSADVVWLYKPWKDTYTCIKNRYGDDRNVVYHVPRKP